MGKILGRVQSIKYVVMETFHHKELFTSKHRNNWFYKQIKQACIGKICMDIGAGSGILSLFAIHAGASHVYMIEHNPDCCNMIEKVFKSAKIPSTKYTLIREEFNSNFIFTDKVDMIISETISSNLFRQSYPSICRVVQNIKALKDAIIIPDKLYGSLVFFEEISIFDKLKFQPYVITTGVPEVDKDFTFLSDVIDHHDGTYKARLWRPKHERISAENVQQIPIYQELWHAAKKSTCFTMTDIITFDAYNLNNKFEWRALCMIPNKTYGIMFIGALGCERTNSTKHIMNLDAWATNFYKFTKMSDILNIKFDMKEKNFVFRSI